MGDRNNNSSSSSNNNVGGGDSGGGGNRGGGGGISNNTFRRYVDLPNYTEQRAVFCKFLQEFTSSNGAGVRPYHETLQAVANRDTALVNIKIADVLAFTGDHTLARNIAQNTMRYREVMSQAIDIVLDEIRAGGEHELTYNDDVIDVLMRQRQQQQEEARRNDPDAAAMEGDSSVQPFPPQLMRRYDVNFIPLNFAEEVSKSGVPTGRAVRDVTAADIGHLVSLTVMVTRVTDVKPLVTVATYTCDECGFEIYQEIKARTFLPLTECKSARCVENKNPGKLFLQTRGSKFSKFQTAKVQEIPSQVPVGHIPRSMNVYIRGDLTRQLLPGNIVTLAGVFLPIRYTGYKALTAGLTTDTYLEVMQIQKHKQNFSDMRLTREVEHLIDQAVADENIYTKLAKSLAPEIYGHLDVKKALLLQLVGGVSRNMKDGLSIRGDINVCLMGDPGVAKSQLLKYISSLSPRGIYTTGKGSSGVGLTASVIRDKVTSETTLEGGALVLADKGICCIDEFDKMEESDRTAIHEVMEQQTVSIAKAGITTTLNARTAILAAANPLFGRYNKRKSPSANINLPAALLSRFDLMFLLLDTPNIDSDRALAEHITFVHQHKEHPDLSFEPLSKDFIRAYVAQARQVEPHVPPQLAHYIVEEYVDMRQRDQEKAEEHNEAAMMTARQLLSILRLSQALARLHFSPHVTEPDINEAIRLVHTCKAQLVEEDERQENREDPISAIYHIIIDYMRRADRQDINYTQVEPMVLKKGFTAEHLQQTLTAYEDLSVWRLNATRTKITLCH